jgi:hypothetical protein
VTTGKAYTNSPKRTTSTTTTRTPQKTTKSLAKDAPTTKRKAATLKPFNLFDFYLKDYASKAPIVYQPVQFSERSRVIILRDESSSLQPTPSSTPSLAPRLIDPTTTRWQELRFVSPLTTRVPSSIETLSFYNSFGDFAFNSNNNRIGRVVPNITPHSFDYLLRLTTPRTPFNRS